MVTLPARKGDFAVYESKDGRIRFHIERTITNTLFGVENVSEGLTLYPRDKGQIEKLCAKHGLEFKGIDR